MKRCPAAAGTSEARRCGHAMSWTATAPKWAIEDSKVLAQSQPYIRTAHNRRRRVPPLPPGPPPDQSDHRGRKRNLQERDFDGAILVHDFLGPSPPPPLSSNVSLPRAPPPPAQKEEKDWTKGKESLWLLEAPVRKMILQMHTLACTSQCWGRQTPAWTRSVHLDAPGQRHGQQPISGTADPQSSQTGPVIKGLR